jgi:Ca2+/Na+ antiporter
MKSLFTILFLLLAYSSNAQQEQPVEPQSTEVLDNETPDLKEKRKKSFKTVQISGVSAGVSALLVLHAIFLDEVPEAVGVVCIGTGVVSSAIFLASTVKTIVYSIKLIKANRKRGRPAYSM